MVEMGGVFDADQHESLGSFDPIPAGDYAMAITGSSMAETKAKTGKYYKFEFTILEGDHKGRKLWNNLNVINPNPIAVEIAKKELSTICKACNKRKITDTMELHGIPFIGKIKVRPAEGDWPATNGMVNYKPLKGGLEDVVATVSEMGAKPASQKGVPWA